MSSTARPTKFRDRWRIRWIDENGRRQSAVYLTHREAVHELRLRQAEVEEVRRGTRQPTPTDRTMGQLFDYWLEHRASQKRSKKHDESIIRAHLRPSFESIVLRRFSLEDVHRFVGDPTTSSAPLSMRKSLFGGRSDRPASVSHAQHRRARGSCGA